MLQQAGSLVEGENLPLGPLKLSNVYVGLSLSMCPLATSRLVFVFRLRFRGVRHRSYTDQG